jgi:large subunit ribosomal protein L22
MATATETTQAPTVRAKARFVRVAPRKARLIADQIRGLEVAEAQTLLAFSSRGAARDVLKLVNSAAANAEANHDLIADDLRVAEVRIDEGPTLKRWRARARGRATRIEKKTCHMSVVLTPIEDE